MNSPPTRRRRSCNPNIATATAAKQSAIDYVKSVGPVLPFTGVGDGCNSKVKVSSWS